MHIFFIVPHKFPLTLVWRTCICVCLHNTVIVKSTKCSFIHWNVNWILITPLKKLKSWHFKLVFGCKFLRFSHSPINTVRIYVSISVNEKWTLNPRVFMISAFLPFTVFHPERKQEKNYKCICVWNIHLGFFPFLSVSLWTWMIEWLNSLSTKMISS